MLALRSFARALPRATFRASPIVARSSQRLIAVSRPSMLSRTTPYKSFSTTRVWREAAGDRDAELSVKLASEYDVEDEPKMPEGLQDYLDSSGFQVTDEPGTESIILTKQFGNESIKVKCSIADMLGEQDDLEDDDDALADEGDLVEPPKRTINQQGKNFDIAPEDSLTQTEEGLEGATSYPIHLTITIDKGDAGATDIMARAQDGEIAIDFVHFYPKGSLTDPNSTAERKVAENVYGGPPFTNLDFELQEMYDMYIEQRGIDAQLAAFLPQYIDYKEQREYMKWLQDLKNFIDA